MDDKLPPGASAPPSGSWPSTVSLFLVIVLIITILVHVSDPRTAIALAIVAAFGAVEAVCRLVGVGRTGTRFARLPLQVVRELIAALPLGAPSAGS